MDYKVVPEWGLFTNTPPLKKGQLYGVEVECELKAPWIDLLDQITGWRGTKDSSLRGNFPVEFVLKRPGGFMTTLANMRQLWESVIDVAGLSSTMRASTHFHVDVRGWTCSKIFSFLTAYYILEEVLTTYFCGEGRKGNLFCVTSAQSDLPIQNLIALCENRMEYQKWGIEHQKYGAMNLAALRRYGSLEFRSLRTPTKAEDAILVLTVLNEMVKEAGKHKGPLGVILDFSQSGAFNFISRWMGEKALKKIEGVEIGELDNMLLDGVMNVQDIAFLPVWREIENA